MNSPGEGVPSVFRTVVETLDAARPRSEVRLTPIPAPRRLAPFAHALEASVLPAPVAGAVAEEEPEELADGRFVLLHDPDGQDGWFGTLRVVTLARAAMEPELGTDPLLPEVTWSWLAEAVDGAQGPGWAEPSGTVTLAVSRSFGGLAERPPTTELELRASWSPIDEAAVAGHLLGWCGMLAQCAGLPPEPVAPGVAALPRRRAPRRGDPRTH